MCTGNFARTTDQRSNTIPPTYATKLGRLMYERGYTTRSLGDEIGVSYQTVWNWSRGATWPTAKLGLKLSQHFGEPVRELLAPENQNGVTAR